MVKLIDLTHMRFGRLLVVGRALKKGVHPRWLFRCDCGTTGDVSGAALRSGNTRSCGCLKREVVKSAARTHGMSNTRVFNAWLAMRQRCYDEKHVGFKNYGKRGIRVCVRWHSFDNFLADMGEPPPGHSLDRRDNNKGYSPDNCYWATRAEQNRNKRTNRVVTVGSLRMCVKDWARAAGMDESLIRGRLNRGWPEEAAVLLPAFFWRIE